MCEYAQEVKDCLAKFVEGERAFSAWNVTKAVRSVVGPGTNVSHEEVKGMVHVLMEDNDEFDGLWNGQYVEYTPADADDDLDDGGSPALDAARKAIEQIRLNVVRTQSEGALENFLDREHLVFRGEVVKLRFDQPVSVVEIRAG